jgi:putative Holliday junction resolvase
MINGEIIGLDYGSVRTGVARINSVAKLSQPLEPIIANNDDTILLAVNKLITNHDAVAIVVGLPRSLEGQDTDQTRSAQAFARKIQTATRVPVYMIDEAGTSKAARERIGEKKNQSIDSAAAAILLEDFINARDTELLRVGDKQ